MSNLKFPSRFSFLDFHKDIAFLVDSNFPKVSFKIKSAAIFNPATENIIDAYRTLAQTLFLQQFSAYQVIDSEELHDKISQINTHFGINAKLTTIKKLETQLKDVIAKHTNQ